MRFTSNAVVTHRLPLLHSVSASPAPEAAVPTPQLPEEEPSERRDLMQIGDLARDAQKTVRTIHLYEQLGLLTPAARSKGRFRLYGREALMRIRWIGKLQEMGFSLSDIQTVVREWEHMESAPGAMRRMREVYARKLEETLEHKRRVEDLERELRASLLYLDTCDVCDAARLLSECECCDLHDKETDVPDLVRGFRADGTNGKRQAAESSPQTGSRPWR